MMYDIPDMGIMHSDGSIKWLDLTAEEKDALFRLMVITYGSGVAKTVMQLTSGQNKCLGHAKKIP